MVGDRPSGEANTDRRGYRHLVPPWSILLGAAGAAAALASALADPSAAGPAAGQTWPAFVLVAGLLLIGLVASADGLFEWAGAALARSLPDGRGLFAGAAALVAVVSAVLNLDTAVAFLTPVMVHTARRRDGRGQVLVASCLLLANAGSLLLPGSNLTNLIVQSGHPIAGWTFLARMALPWLLAVAVTTAVIGGIGRTELSHRVEVDVRAAAPVLEIGVGLVGVAAGVALMLALADPAPEVAAAGVAVAVWCLYRRRITVGQVRTTLGVPVLVGLFGLAVALGTLGRAWNGPGRLLDHLDPWATAAVGAVVSVLVNNLPAAALLSAHRPPHPLSLLIGLDLGPNLFVTGSLAWVLWAGAARQAGAVPDLRGTVRMGLVAAPMALAAATGGLLLTTART